jgi:hypothetical protein
MVSFAGGNERFWRLSLGADRTLDIGQSKASISEGAVPETSTWAMMALGFAGLAFAYRRARKVAMIG